MKVFGKILKVLAALAAIAGAVYVAITYGDKIVAWVKEKLNLNCCSEDCCCCDCDCEETPAEEAAQEPDAAVEEDTSVQAEQADFEG